MNGCAKGKSLSNVIWKNRVGQHGLGKSTFETHTDDRTSFVFLLSTGTRGAVRRLAEHVLAGCVDLAHLKANQPGLVFVSLFDDTEDVWRAEDFNLVNEYSEIARWSRPDEFESLLRAR